jgi:hypothetical protein
VQHAHSGFVDHVRMGRGDGPRRFALWVGKWLA